MKLSRLKRETWNGKIRNEDLRVGDAVKMFYGWTTVTEIRPYVGPLADIVFAVADVKPGPGFSLERGGYTEVAVP
jgi:hypothetical protein